MARKDVVTVGGGKTENASLSDRGRPLWSTWGGFVILMPAITNLRASEARALRCCPACSTESLIGAGERLWPPLWRCEACGTTLPLAKGFSLLAPSLDETDEGMMRDGFSFLADVEDKHFWFRSRNILIGWLIRIYAPTAGRAIEIGCGTGYVLHAIDRHCRIALSLPLSCTRSAC